MIFEAQIPNPNPELGPLACKPIGEFWAALTGAELETRTEQLRQAFLTGHAELSAAGFAPFLSVANLTHGRGQVRVNFFDEGPWNLREYKLIDRDGVAGAELVPTAAHIFSRFFADDFGADASHCRQSILDSVPNFLGNNINTMSWDIPQDCLANESPNIFSHNYESELNANGSELAADIQEIIDASEAAGTLSASDVAKRMNFTQNCMGCHVQADPNLGGGLTVSSPPAFVHVSEFGSELCLPDDETANCFRISNLLKADFLPHRKQVLEELLCLDNAVDEPGEEIPEPGPIAPVEEEDGPQGPGGFPGGPGGVGPGGGTVGGGGGPVRDIAIERVTPVQRNPQKGLLNGKLAPSAN